MCAELQTTGFCTYPECNYYHDVPLARNVIQSISAQGFPRIISAEMPLPRKVQHCGRLPPPGQYSLYGLQDAYLRSTNALVKIGDSEPTECTLLKAVNIATTVRRVRIFVAELPQSTKWNYDDFGGLDITARPDLISKTYASPEDEAEHSDSQVSSESEHFSPLPKSNYGEISEEFESEPTRYSPVRHFTSPSPSPAPVSLAASPPTFGSSDDRFCPSCKSENLPGWKFCSFCGQKASTQAPIPMFAPALAPVPTRAPVMDSIPKQRELTSSSSSLFDFREILDSLNLSDRYSDLSDSVSMSKVHDDGYLEQFGVRPFHAKKIRAAANENV